MGKTNCKIAKHDLLNLEGTKRHFRTLSVLTKLFWGRNSQTTKNYKNCGFSGNCLKPKMTPFWKKGFSDGWKVGFTNCVFGKLCLLKTLFYCVFRKTQQLQQTSCMLKNRTFMKNNGLFLTWQKGVVCLGVLLHFWCVVVGCVVFVLGLLRY